MTNFALPINTTLVSDVLELLRDRDSSIAKMDYAGDTNLSAGFVRFNRSNRVFEEWNGSAWVEQRTEQPGIIKPFAGSSAPRGHLLCDGSAVNTYAYRELHAVISATYGGTAYQAGVTDISSATSTFNLPDLRGRFPLGKSTTGTGSTLGSVGGALDHTHSIPAHYHSMGAGADLSISSSGSHTTTIDISHGHTASSAYSSSNTSISGNKTGSATVSLKDDGHGHAIEGHGTTTPGDGKNTGNAGNKFAKARQTALSGGLTGDTNGSTFAATTNISLVNGTHTHDVSIADATHNHSITVDSLPASTNKSDAGGLHTHGKDSFSGSIGLVSGGVSGNSAMTSGQANPPFMSLNYIITV